MATQKWAAPAAAVTVLTSTDLSALANDAAATSALVTNNDTELNQTASFMWDGAIATAPTADKTLDLYALYSLDGTTYEDFTAARPSAMGLLGSFVLDNTGSAQKKFIIGALILPFKFKLVLVNKSGYALTGTNTVKMFTNNQQVL